MRGLTNLCIINNELTSFPTLIGFHKNLSSLQVDGNPLKQIRRQIIDKGTAGLMEFLRDKFREGTDD